MPPHLLAENSRVSSCVHWQFFGLFHGHFSWFTGVIFWNFSWALFDIHGHFLPKAPNLIEIGRSWAVFVGLRALFYWKCSRAILKLSGTFLVFTGLFWAHGQIRYQTFTGTSRIFTCTFAKILTGNFSRFMEKNIDYTCIYIRRSVKMPPPARQPKFDFIEIPNLWLHKNEN